MKYAIISDIHSNLESLTTFLRILRLCRVEKIVCLGDLVGYNPNPNECVEIISSISNLEIIRGNHDRAVVNNDYYLFSDNARKAVKWTIKNLTIENLSFLSKMEKGPKIIDNKFGICHGSAIDEDDYLLTPYHAKGDFRWLINNNINLLFFGHTHYQIIYRMKKNLEVEAVFNKKMTLRDDSLYVINPGSIGQPRDGDPRASFILYDSDKNRIEVIRYEYPLNKTQSKILNIGLPLFLADRLAYGK